MKSFSSKKCFVVCVVLGMLLGSTQMHAQTGKITLSANNITLKEAFAAIESQSDYSFLIRNNDVNLDTRVSVNVKDASIDEILRQLLRGKNISYEINEKRVTIFSPTPPPPQLRPDDRFPLSGTVVDENGEAVIGASVLVDGTTNGAVTDLDGKFEIVVRTGDRLNVSAIGYTATSLDIASRGPVTVSLAEDFEMLEETVVIGYGVQRKSDLTGSLVSISSENITDSHKQSAVASIQGTIPGVDIIRNGAQPGAGFNIMVRGQNTISNNGDRNSESAWNSINPPLYVVDGIMLSSIDDIAPEDIERIDVLKDASSTAIYGSRGANGVVIVTTKKGSEGKSFVEYNGFVGVSQAYNLPDMLYGEDYVKYRINRYKGQNWTSFLHGEADPAPVTILTNAQYANYKAGKYVDWAREMLEPGISQNHSVRAFGTAKGTVYSFGLGYTDEDGVTGADRYSRYNFSSSADKQFSKILKGGLSMYTTYTSSVTSQSAIQSAFRLNPLGNMYNEDGSLCYFPEAMLTNCSNPLTERDLNQARRVTLHAFGNIYLEVNPVEWLTFKTTFSPDVTFYRNGSYGGKNTSAGRGATSGTNASESWLHSISYTWSNILNFDKTFGGIHKLSVMAGTEWVKNTSDDMSASVMGYTTDHYTFYNMAAGSSLGRGGLPATSFKQDQWFSAFARFNYNLKERYMFTVTGRYDGSSRLAPGHKWAFFPSVAFAWRVTEEPFMDAVPWINNLKLRLSYGKSGNNQNVAPYSTTATVSNSYYTFGTNNVTATTISRMENTSLSWETTAETNLGLDFGFFKGRINGSVDLYKRRTDNILMNRVMARLNGYDSVIDNVGVVDNKGVEIALNTVNVKYGDWSWITNFNFTMNRNEIVELSDGKTSDEANKWFVGHSVGDIWTFQQIGYWGINEIDQAAVYGKVPGQIKILDVNNDGALDNADKGFIGSRFPKWSGGVTSNLSWKNFNLAVNIYARMGQMSWSQFHWTTALDDNQNFGHMNLKYWTPEDPDNAEWLRAGTGSGNGYAEDTIYPLMYQDTSYWKIGYITLSYDFNKRLLEKVGISKCHVYLSCQNPYLNTKYKGLNPEDASKNSGSYYFLSRMYQLGLNLTF